MPKVTSSRTVMRHVEVRYTIEELRDLLRYKDHDGNEQPVPHNAVISRITPDPKHAPNRWEVVASFDLDEGDEWYPEKLGEEPVSISHNESVVLKVIEDYQGNGITDKQIAKLAKKLGVGESPAKKARLKLLEAGFIVKAGTRRGRGKTTGASRVVYKLAGRLP